MRDPFAACPGKISGRSWSISRGDALHRKGERNSRVVPPFPESPRCLSPFQRNLFSLHCLDFHAEDRLPPRWHVGQPCGKASWESLVGKPRGKTVDPLIQAAECMTLLLPLWRKAQVHARIRDEDDTLGRLQKYPKIHVSTGEESSGSGPTAHKVLGPSIEGRRIPRGCLATRMGTSLS